MSPARAVHHFPPDEVVDRLGDKTFVPEGARAVEFPFARIAARFVDDALVRRGECSVAEQRAGLRHAVAQIDLRRRRPFLTEQLLDLLNCAADSRHNRKAARCIADRELEHVRKPPRPKLAQHEQPAVESAGNDGGEMPGAGDELEPEFAEVFDRRCRGRGSLCADHANVVVARAVEDRREITARAVQMRLDDLQREAGSDRRVERIPAALEH